MALFALLGVLRGFPAAVYRRTPHRKPLCGLDQDKNCSFLNWTLNGISTIRGWARIKPVGKDDKVKNSLKPFCWAVVQMIKNE